MGAAGRGSRGAFEATAYCRGRLTASGVSVRAGIAAADPKILPIGSVIQVDGVAGAVSRHLHRARHRPGDPGPRGRHLHVELRRGGGLRPRDRSS